MPNEVVFMILLLDAAISLRSFHDSTLILFSNCIFNFSAFSIVLLITIILLEPSDSNAAITALLAPPAPSINDDPFFGLQSAYLLFILFIKP